MLNEVLQSEDIPKLLKPCISEVADLRDACRRCRRGRFSWLDNLRDAGSSDKPLPDPGPGYDHRRTPQTSKSTRSRKTQVRTPKAARSAS